MKNFTIALVTMLALICFGCATKSADDAGLTSKVKSKLAADSDTSALHINVDTNNSVVTLSGTASSEKEKSRAEQLAKNTEGVTRVVNNIKVSESANNTNAGERRDGSTAVLTDKDGRNMGDRVSDAMNKAGDKAEHAADKAGEKAKDAANSAGEALSDATILTKIKSQILAAGIVGTNVDVTNGAVLLKGEVENATEKSHAEEIARKTDGVKSVKNMLTVKGNGKAGSKSHNQ